MGLTWMAWTWQTAVFFAFIALCLIAVTTWELSDGRVGHRRGVLGLETTRGDRLFISLLGSAYINIAWLGLIGSPLWGAILVSVIFAVAVFRYV